MLNRYVKIITFYNKIIKLKRYWVSHIAIIGFYVCEICTLALIVVQAVYESININKGIIPDYVLGFNTYFLINHIISYMLLGFFEVSILFIFLIIKFLLRKDFLVKSTFLTNNLIYHIIWTLGIYITLIISIFTAIYLLSISCDGFLWLIEKWQT